MSEAPSTSKTPTEGPKKRWAPVWIGGLLLAVMALFVGLRLELTSDITHFLAAGDDARLAKLSRQLAESDLTKTTILVIGYEGTETDAGSGTDSGSGDAQTRRREVIAAVDALAETLSAHGEVAWVRSGWAEDQNDAIYDLYFPRRFYFTAGSEAELEQSLSPEGLAAHARELQDQFRLPTAAMVKRIAPADPLLRYPAALSRLERARAGPLTVVDGHFMTQTGDAVLFFGSRHSPFRAQYQGPLQAALDARFAELRATQPELSLMQSGVGRFALQAEAQIRGDITRISILSTLGVIALFLLLFRGPRLVFLSLVPLAAGVLSATAVSLLLFTKIHGLTLAFGASLIGICIDYPVHLFNHHVLTGGAETGGAAATAKRIRPGLILGAATTVAGFVGLGWTSFPGVREIAVFAAVGVSAALVATLWLLPPLMSDRPQPVALQRRLATMAGRVLAAMDRRRWALLIPPALAVVAIGLAVPRLEFEDDVSALTSPDEALLAEDEAVREQVSRMDAGRMVVAIGDDEEAALRKNDEIYAHLVAAREAGELSEFRSLHDLVWSRSLQRENLAAYGDSEAFLSRLETAYVGEGFRAGVFGPFAADLAALDPDAGPDAEQGPPPLDLETLAASPLADAAASMRVDLDGQVGVLTLMRGVEDPARLRARIEATGIDDVHFFDQRALMAELYGQHRAQTLRLVGVGLFAVFGMILLRYRSLRQSLAAFLPALLATGAALAAIVLMGFSLTLLHVVSLLLVLSMGVDYGVFLAESRAVIDARGGGDSSEGPGELEATLLSLVACCASTVLAFGLLAMSPNPALRAIGLTTGLGVLASLVLAPTTLILFSGRTEKDATP